jgi:molecular chaperone GrpE
MKKKMDPTQTDASLNTSDDTEMNVETMDQDEIRENETNGVSKDESSAETRSEEQNSHLTREEQLEAQIEELRDQLLRKAAEMENMRKRMQRDRAQVFDQSKAAALEAFLPVNDDLQRTLEALKSSNPDPAFLEGTQMVADKFEAVLSSFGVEKISESNVPFDLNLHEALMRQPSNDPSIPSDTVLQVLENGYRIGEKVLRHAKVIVSE